jgi:hypothetical protein
MGKIRFKLAQLRDFRPEAEHLSALGRNSSKLRAKAHTFTDG